LKIKFTAGFIDDWNRLFSDNFIYSIPRWISNVKYETKWAWQRVFRGFDDRWYWSLNSQLALIIPKCVRKMKDGYSYPFGINYKQWKEILEKIALGFEAIEKIDEDFLLKDIPSKRKKYEKLEKQYDEGMELFVKWFNDLWD